MGALMTNTTLTYDDLAEATAFLADRLLAAQVQVLDLNQQLAAAQGEVAALRGMLEFEQERSRELRNRGDQWQIVAAERPLHWPMMGSASRPRFFGKLRRFFS